MKNVIIINSDDHGFVGVAQNYKNAIDCLLEWSGYKLYYHLKDDLDRWDYLTGESEEDFEEIYDLNIEEFNKKFEGSYYLQIEPLW